MDLSVVIPVYKSASFLAERLDVLARYLETTGLDWEVIPVDDGSPDESARVLSGVTHPRIKPVICSINRGKFAALRTGMAQARGRCRIFTDADVPYELDAIPKMARLVNERRIHIVIGDRTLPGSHYRQDMTPIRRAATTLFTLFIRMFVTGGLFDTQCGLKALRGDVADAIFPLLREAGFAGDVELLYIALKHNLEVKRIPVRLQHAGPSTVHALRHGLAMLASLLRIRLNQGRGRYASPALTEISRQDAS